MCPINFTSIGETALIILNRLQCELRIRELSEEQKTDTDGGAQEQADDDHARKAEDHRRFVEQRIRELAAFERRASGKG